MARALIVGCGCRGRALGARLSEQGLAVRGTSRTREGGAAIELAGIEAACADPGDPGTILDLVGDVAIVVWLLGSLSGSSQQAEAIHGDRLEGLLSRLVDTPVRGFAYEAAGDASAVSLARGRGLVASAAATWSIPVAFIEQAPGDGWAEWSVAACEAVLRVLR